MNAMRRNNTQIRAREKMDALIMATIRAYKGEIDRPTLVRIVAQGLGVGRSQTMEFRQLRIAARLRELKDEKKLVFAGRRVRAA